MDKCRCKCLAEDVEIKMSEFLAKLLREGLPTLSLDIEIFRSGTSSLKAFAVCFVADSVKEYIESVLPERT